MKKEKFYLLITMISLLTFTLQAEDTILPVPDPPSLEKRINYSDIILHVKLLHAKKITFGAKIISQPRFQIISILKSSPFFKIQDGELFSVNHELHPSEWGPFFQESPEPGEYIVFLNLRNLVFNGKISYYTELYSPHPFALESVMETPLSEIKALLQK